MAPLLCAGITTYSPLRHWKVGPGQKVGVIGLGGLGHMGVKFAKALGAHVVMITTSPEKGKDAQRLGADEVLVSRDADAMAKHAGSFDFLLNTIPVSHDVNPYLALLKRDGTMVLVGVLTALEPPLHGRQPHRSAASDVAGSAIGGMAETQEMIDFCAEHDIVSDIEMVPIRRQRGLRAPAEERREIPLRDRYENAERSGLSPQAGCARVSVIGVGGRGSPGRESFVQQC